MKRNYRIKGSRETVGLKDEEKLQDKGSRETVGLKDQEKLQD